MIPGAQQPLRFDLDEGERRKEMGIALAESSRGELLDLAKAVAIQLAQRWGEITYDDVYLELLRLGKNPAALGNAAGAVFRGKEWEFTGEWRKSHRVTSHARRLMVWKLRQE